MDKDAIMNRLTKPNNSAALFNEVAASYVSKIKFSRNYAVISGVPFLEPPANLDNLERTVRLHHDLIMEILEVLIDKFNHHADEPIVTGQAYASEFSAVLGVFMHSFYNKHQGKDPVTTDKCPVMTIEIKYEEDKDSECFFFSFSCTAVIKTTEHKDVMRQMQMKFYN